ncbi:MAG: class I SAM-dependent methyltransferase [Gemmatimonadaceae bacterium]
MSYDAESVRRHFDTLGEREWDRLERTLQGRVKYAVHKRQIEKHVRDGMRVLDAGCGPGRFAIDIARLGARVTLVDISDVQLDLARKRLADAEVMGHVGDIRRMDVLDMSAFGESSFDAVVCFGGAVSYTTRQHVDALRQLARVAKPGAPVLVSVMSLIGALRLIGPLDAASVLESWEAHLDFEAVRGGADVILTNPTSNEFHKPLALFTAQGLRTALESAGLGVETIAASDSLIPEYFQIPKINASEKASAELIALEVALSERPGLVDGGGHLIGVGRKAV